MSTNDKTNLALLLKIKRLREKVDYLNSQLKNKKFGLSWIDVPESFDAESENKIPILEEVPELAIYNDDGKPTHILIEGDNYHALTCLNYTHHGKVDVIYIDPPYNTGSDGFTYKDSRFLMEYPDGTTIPKNHPLRHSAWLSFMEKRLKLAKELLSEKGVILISIDENEILQLKYLCDSLFGENNLEGCITWESRTQPINAGNAKWQLQQKTEFILFYSKNKAKRERFILKKNEEDSPQYPHLGELGRCRFEIIEKSDAGQYKRDSMKFPILGQYPRAGKRWQIGLETALDLVKNKRIEIVDNIVKRAYYPEDEIDKISYYPFWSHYSASEVGTALSAKDELNSIMGTNVGFDTVKPVKLITELLSHLPKDSIILDFFGGSGTTLHSTMQLNSEDGGKRQCILCQLDEANICKSVTYIRNRKIMLGYSSSKKMIDELYRENLTIKKLKSIERYLEIAENIKNENIDSYDNVVISVKDGCLIVEGVYNKGTAIPGLGNSLKYYRTSFVGKNQPKDATDEDKLMLAKKANCLLSIAENTLYETESTDYYQLYTDNMGKCTAIYFQEDYSKFDEFRNKVIELGGKVNVYIFSWTNGSEFESEFEFEDNISVKSIPQPILDIYKSLNI